MRPSRAAIIGIVVVSAILVLVAFRWSRPNYSELLTAINDFRAVVPLARSKTEDYLREHGRCGGLLDRHEKTFNPQQRDAAKKYHAALFVLDSSLKYLAQVEVEYYRRPAHVRLNFPLSELQNYRELIKLEEKAADDFVAATRQLEAALE